MFYNLSTTEQLILIPVCMDLRGFPIDKTVDLELRGMKKVDFLIKKCDFSILKIIESMGNNICHHVVL